MRRMQNDNQIRNTFHAVLKDEHDTDMLLKTVAEEKKDQNFD